MVTSPSSSPSSFLFWFCSHPLIPETQKPAYVSPIKLLTVSIFIHKSEITLGQGHVTPLGLCANSLVSGGQPSTWEPTLSIRIHSKKTKPQQMSWCLELVAKESCSAHNRQEAGKDRNDPEIACHWGPSLSDLFISSS